MSALLTMHSQCLPCRSGHTEPCRRHWTDATYAYVCVCECPEGTPVADGPREVLVHLHVTVPVGDDRTANDLADSIESHLRAEVARHSRKAHPLPTMLQHLDIVATMAEEV
jgi:hypothetical protein